MMGKTALGLWHDYFKSGDMTQLDALLADDAVFESPVVHTPQLGKAITFKYLSSAAKVLGGDGFRYVGEWHAENSAILEFETVLNGITINGIDMIWWNEDQKITRFKVMVRPLKAVNMLHQLMGGQLAAG
jgi:ketosteroid isomerase-like protein